MPRYSVTLLLALTQALTAQQQPNLASQRAAMKKLEFLVGKWSGPASVARGPGEALKLTQSEDVQMKLDGLVLTLEGTGRNSEGRVVFTALATISFDDSTSLYRLRAYNDGRYLDTELKVPVNGFEWGYTAGTLRVSNTMRLTEKGEWYEVTETTYGSAPARRSLEMTLTRVPAA